MIKRIPLSFTTIQNEDLKPIHEGSSDPLVLFDPNSYITDRVRRNSGNAGTWAIFSKDSKERVVAIAKPNLDITKKFNFDDLDWNRCSLVWKSPVKYVGPINPKIKIIPIIAELDSIGRGAFFTPEQGEYTKTWDFPNWIHRSSGVPWDGLGATGLLDVDVANQIVVPLLRDEERESSEFKIELNSNILQGLLDGSYSALRISIVLDDEAEKCQAPIQFSNDLSRNYTTTPYLQYENIEDQFLDRTGNFLLWGENDLSIQFTLKGIPTFPEVIDATTNLKLSINATVSLLYRKYKLTLFETNTISVDQENCILKSTCQIDPSILDSTVVDLLVGEGYIVDQPASTIPDYDDPTFYEIWNSASNENYRESVPVIKILGDTTLREVLTEGNSRFKVDLESLWQITEDTTISAQTEWNRLGSREIRVSNFDEFGSFVGKFDGEVYPRVTTVGLRRRFIYNEGPQKVIVFIDDRPPQQMANATLRRTANKRYSGLYEDLAWGIVSGSQINSGNWIVEPSDATLLSHDGNYHYFYFDVEALPLGPLKFEFVRLYNNSIIRQINSVTFVVDNT